jgi:hypothetical protein
MDNDITVRDRLKTIFLGFINELEDGGENEKKDKFAGFN